MEQYIQPFIDVTVDVFKQFIGCDIKTGRPHFSEQSDVKNWDVSSVIGFTGEARGAVVVSFKVGLAIELTNMLTEQNHSTIDDEVIDAVGEIVNIIAGNVKRNLEAEFRLVISLPTVIHGKDFTLTWPTSQTRVICIPFILFEETFCLYIALESYQGQ
jgi:chemotaxis protein CheX